jgi:hypothetical protein
MTIPRSRPSQVRRRNSCDARDQRFNIDDQDTITGQLVALGLEVPEARVIDLSAAHFVPPWVPGSQARSIAEPPLRPGQHLQEAKAALSMFDEASMEPGGGDWQLVASAIAHALLAIEEALRDGAR